MNDSKPFSSASSACLAIDGSKIKSIRESKKLTQLYVATCLGVTVDTISRWENGRSPNIKLDNAEKLAEVLEIPLSDIESAPAERVTNQDLRDQSPTNRFRRPAFWLLLLAIVLITALSWHYLAAPPAAPPHFTATRVLPGHASTGQPFPVLIKVQASATEPVSFIVKEILPAGCQTRASQPTLLASQQQRKTVKWLSSSDDDEPLYFSYLAQADASFKEGTTLFFQGEVMVQGQGAFSEEIGGNDSVTLTNFHWADSNQDLRIDDEEILSIYNAFDILQDLGVDIDMIRRIWAGTGYRWDGEAEKFVLVP